MRQTRCRGRVSHRQGPSAGFERDILASREARAATPAQARNFLDCMRGMFRWALEAEHVGEDPTEGVKNPRRPKTDGFKEWDQGDVAKYEARWPVGTRERVWMHVILYIGSRRGDAVTHGKQHVKQGVISFTTEKSRNGNVYRVEVSRRIEPELAETLRVGPTSDLAFICGDHGTPLTKESFGNYFKEACVLAGIPDKSAHGLRKLSATIWAERGATEHELMAMFGWMTPQMAALYTRKARRKMLALNASDRLPRTVNEHSMCPPEGTLCPPEKTGS
jgi:integrase